jgi:PAS domain S-box-containing protein
MTPCDPSSEGLADVLEARSRDIARRWEEQVRRELASANLPQGELVDTLPQFLAAVVATLRGKPAPGRTPVASTDTIADAHGAQRFRVGVDITTVVREYALLRSIILDVLLENACPLDSEALKRLLEALGLAASQALRRYAEEHAQVLQASEAKLQNIIDHAPAVIAAKDSEGHYLFVNRCFEEQVGARRQDIVGRTDYDCFPREVADSFRATDAQVLATGQPLEVEEVVPREDGPHLWRSLKFPLPREGDSPYATCCISTDITLSRRMRQERDEARERLSHVLVSLPIICWSFDAQGVVLLSEGQGLERLGLKPGQIVGQSVYDIIRGNSVVLNTIQRALRGETFSEELEFQGSWFEAIYRPERGQDGKVKAVMGLALDISERRRAQEELRQSETRYRLATLATHDIVWDWDVGKGQVQWSENFQRFIGHTLTGVDTAIDWWAEHVHPEDRQRVVSGLYAALDGGEAHWSDEYRFRRGDGSYMLVTDRGYVVRDAHGHALRMVGALQDITERKRAEQEAQRRADFEQHLIGIVSHDLRNPINAISMATTLLLRQGGLDAPRRRTLERILGSAERATRLLADLLDFTQARLQGALPVKLRPVDLHELTRQVVEEVQLAHPSRQLVLEQRGEGRGEWDADRLAQLITNLVSNALAYGAVHCAVRVRTVGLPDEVRLSVHNTGEPIPPKLMGQLFQPLKRGEDTAAPGKHSIGLGLFIVKHIVDAHGGSLSVESTVESGTTFTVSLPRHPPPAPPSSPA